MDILLRFWSYPVALTADIEKISVAEEDRNSLRLLWVDDITKSDPVIQAFQFTRVIFGVSSSPFLLNATVDYHLKRFVDAKPELVNLKLRSIYVDDIVMGSDDIDTAKKLYRESKSIFHEGGFNLRKFSTNEPELQQFFDAADQSTLTSDSTESSEETYAKSTLGRLQAESFTDQKILGVKWNVFNDCLLFSVKEIAAIAKEDPTKREVTSVVGKFYDPLGYLSPIVIKFKMFSKSSAKCVSDGMRS